MSEPLPPATQSLGKDNKINRTAICPVHHKTTRVDTGFIGPAEGHVSGREVWIFQCVALSDIGKKAGQKGHKADHTFAALADRTAPRTAEESVEWMKAQRESRAKLPTRSQS